MSRYLLFLMLTTTTVSAQSPEAVAARAFDLMAGPAWENARYFAFTFNVEREGKIAAAFPQRLDRNTGDYREKGSGLKFLVSVDSVEKRRDPR